MELTEGMALLGFTMNLTDQDCLESDIGGSALDEVLHQFGYPSEEEFQWAQSEETYSELPDDYLAAGPALVACRHIPTDTIFTLNTKNATENGEDWIKYEQ